MASFSKLMLIGKTASLLCCIAALLYPAGSVFATDMYKYKDSNGRWVYTDKKPKDQKIEYQHEKMLVTEQSSKVSVVNRGSSARPVLYAVNALEGPAQIWLQLYKQENIHLHPTAETEWIVEGPAEQFLAYVSPIEANRSWAYEWQPRYAPGKPMEARQIDPAPITTPFVGGPFVISQGFKGEASHSAHAESHYAVDIQMPEGTPIRAVRSGKVMELERNFSRSGWDDKYADEANFIRILHSDGSMAVYAHLKPESVTVALGAKVKVGDVIGTSGNTGYSTGPHLHFVIQYNGGKRLDSAPFEFTTFGREPKAGDLLR